MLAESKSTTPGKCYLRLAGLLNAGSKKIQARYCMMASRFKTQPKSTSTTKSNLEPTCSKAT